MLFHLIVMRGHRKGFRFRYKGVCFVGFRGTEHKTIATLLDGGRGALDSVRFKYSRQARKSD